MVAQVPVSSRHLREASARLVLDHLWDVDEVTGSTLIEATGLSRATVHGVCDELIEQGWVTELESLRAADARNGRPARRYAFDARAGVVVGVDAGQHRISATVADLRGGTLSRTVLPVSPQDGTASRRLALIEEGILAALADAAADHRSVLAVAVGVPAPVDRDGRTVFQDNPFWELMNPDIALHLRDRHGWTTLTDNDANLAAVAEHWQGHGRDARCHVTLLAGERFGAGVVDDGRLLRGAHGGVGEMRYLDFVEGVGSADGHRGAGARRRPRAAAPPRRAHRLVAAGPGPRDARRRERVRRRPGRGPPRRQRRRARGGAAGAHRRDVREHLRPRARHHRRRRRRVLRAAAGARAARARPVRRPARASRSSRPALGRDIVTVGAVKRALDHVREHALDIVPAELR